MKFVTAALLVATASAAVGTDCSADATKCAATECCGVGKKDTSKGDNQATTDVTVCNTKDAKTYTDSANAKFYTFTCNVAKTGSARLAAGATFVALASYYMA